MYQAGGVLSTGVNTVVNEVFLSWRDSNRRAFGNSWIFEDCLFDVIRLFQYVETRMTGIDRLVMGRHFH